MDVALFLFLHLNLFFSLSSFFQVNIFTFWVVSKIIVLARICRLQENEERPSCNLADIRHVCRLHHWIPLNVEIASFIHLVLNLKFVLMGWHTNI